MCSCRIVQLLLSIVFQLLFMRDLEKLLGWLRICLIYVVCGIAGSLSSAIFIPYHVEVSNSSHTHADSCNFDSADIFHFINLC